MREILFRGKRRDDGRWVYGYLVKLPCPIHVGDSSPWHIIVPPVDPDDNGGRYNVDPDTVGQYTGLTDKNGQRIFEGDILRYINEDGESHYITVVFEECAFLIEDEGITDPDLLTSYGCLGPEVFGNIHDNPDLRFKGGST